MDKRNTIQKELVCNAVYSMRRHVTADEVYEHIRLQYPSIGKGTVYRDLNVLAGEGKVRKIGIPDGPDRFDFRTGEHCHVRCVGCGCVSDVELDPVPDLGSAAVSSCGFVLLDYEILYRGICPDCQKKERMQ